MNDTKTSAPVHPLLEGTPNGPWKLDAGQERCPATDEYEVWVRVVTQSGQLICDVTLEEDSEAIATLIAMAPTLAAENARLRAALEALVRHTTESHMCYPDCVENASKVLASLTT
jgi:hypothetical protein